MADLRDADNAPFPDGLGPDPGEGETPPAGVYGRPSPLPPAGKASGRGVRVLGWLAFVALFAVDLVAGGGLLLRDRVEGRHPSTPEEQVFAPMAELPPPSREARESAVGFGVTQVTVGMAGEGAQAAAAPEPVPGQAAEAHPAPAAQPEGAAAKQGADPYAVAPARAPVPEPVPAKAEKTPPAKAPAEAKGEARGGKAHSPAAAPKPSAPAIAPESPPGIAQEIAPARAARAAKAPVSAKAATAARPARPAAEAAAFSVAVGFFRSQKSIFEAEEKLKKLGYSTFRISHKMRGQGIRVRVASGDPQRKAAAVAALGEAGFALTQEGDATFVYLLFAEEAAQVTQLIQAAGAEAMPVDVEGDLPAWKVYAGPMTRVEAAKAAKRIKASGMDCFVAEVAP